MCILRFLHVSWVFSFLSLKFLFLPSKLLFFFEILFDALEYSKFSFLPSIFWNLIASSRAFEIPHNAPIIYFWNSINYPSLFSDFLLTSLLLCLCIFYPPLLIFSFLVLSSSSSSESRMTLSSFVYFFSSIMPSIFLWLWCSWRRSSSDSPTHPLAFSHPEHSSIVVRPHTTRSSTVSCSPIVPTQGSLCVSNRVPRH